jgi:acyl-CoA thioester hydrolase
MEISSLPVTYRKTIPHEYIDEMGHMNVMWYTHLFDEATYTFFDLFGIGKGYEIETHNGAFALEQHIRYLAEVREGQGITIHTRALGASPKVIHFMHFMVRDHDKVLAATSELVGVHIDMRNRKSSSFPEDIYQRLNGILREHEKLAWDPLVCGVMGVK